MKPDRIALCLPFAALIAGACGIDPSDETAIEHTNETVQDLSRPCGAFSVTGAIEGLYNHVGGRQSFLGCPTTNEVPLGVLPLDGGGAGAFNHFQNGSIYWRASTGPFEVHGAIHAKWAALTWELGPMGWPITNETITPDGVGRFNHFSHGGSIYWTPSTGAHEVHGLIRNYWASTGWERGPLGYPVSDEIADYAGGFLSGWHEFFQLGTIRCFTDGSCSRDRIDFFQGCACLDLSTITDCQSGVCLDFCRVLGSAERPPGCSNACPYWAAYPDGGRRPQICGG